ncbi:MAG: hypothetical protein GQ570_11245 [Helicobacteraceae bacterium]|nr:hypothetical protein [Helicobacteraceae bacterium]
MVLLKREILIKQSSSITNDEAIDYCLNFSKNLEDLSHDKLYFCDLFDSRNNSLIRIYSLACQVYYELETCVFEINKPLTQTIPQNDIFTSALRNSL